MSINQTENLNPVKESQQVKSKVEKKPFFTWGFIFKINALLIAVFAIFGVAVQKGMLKLNRPPTFKTLNSIAQSMGFKKTVPVVSAADMMGLFRLMREYQTCAEHFAQLQTHIDWLNETIQHVKNTTGRHFGEG